MWPFTKKEDELSIRVRGLERRARILEAEKSPDDLVIQNKIIHITSYSSLGHRALYIDDAIIFCDNNDINRLIKFLQKHINEKA